MSAIRRCAVTLVIALCQVQTDGAIFKSGKLYTYSYSNYYATGVHDQKAGRNFEATFTLQYNDTEDLLKLKIQSGNTFAFNKGQIQHSFPYGLEEGEYLKQQWEREFYIAYENGSIRSVYMPEETDLFIFNMKKAVASLFQLNLQPLIENGTHAYTIQEDGIGGDCLTVYNIQPQTTNTELTTVTKTRLYDQCNYRPNILHTSVIGQKCSHCGQEKEVLSSFSRIQFLLKDTEEKGSYVIQKINNHGIIKFAPFTSNGQTVLSVVNQTVILTNVTEFEEDVDKIEVPEDFEAFNSLSFEFHNDRKDFEATDLKEMHYYNRIHEHNKSRSNEDAESSLLLIIQDLDLDDLSSCVIPLIEELRKMNFDQLVYFFERNIKFVTSFSKKRQHADANTTATQQHLRDLLMRVLPLVGTNPSILFIFKLIKERKMLESHVVNAITTFAFHVKEPSESLLDYISVILPRNESIPDYASYYSYFDLAFGTLIFRSCVKNDFNPHPPHKATYISEEKCNSYVDLLIQHYANNRKLPVATTILKAVSNTHHDRIFPFLLEIFRDGNTTVEATQHASKAYKSNHYGYERSMHMDRIAAIWGLWSFLEQPDKREQVASVAASVFLNTTEDHQIRIYAFKAWMFSAPTGALFTDLIDIYHHEPNDKVANQIYEMLAVVANSTDPCFAPFKERARKVLQFISPRQHDSIRHGFIRLFTMFNEKYSYGRMMAISLVPGSYTFFPRDVHLKHSLNILGYNFDILSVGLTGKFLDFGNGLARVLQWAPNTPFYGAKFPSNISGFDEAKLFDSHYPDYATEDLYVGRFNQFTFYGKLHRGADIIAKTLYDSQTATLMEGRGIPKHAARRDASENLEDVTPTTGPKRGDKDFSDKISDSTNIVKNELNFVDVEFVIPNEMGLPVVLSLKVPTSFKIHGRLQNDEHITGYSTSASEIILRINIGAKMRMYGSMYVDCKYFLKSGYQIETTAGLNFPLNGSVKFNFENKQLEAKYAPSADPQDIFQYYSEPITFHYSSQYPVDNGEKPAQKIHHVGHNYFGLGLTLNFTYDEKWNKYDSYSHFVKSFFDTSNKNEEYFTLGQKWLAGTHNILNYAIFNPTGKPVRMNVRLAPCKDYPTTELKSGITVVSADTASDDFLNSTGWKWNVRVEADGPHPRTWSVIFGGKRSWPYRDSREAFFEFRRSAIPEVDKNPLEVCFRSQSSIEDQPNLYARSKTRMEPQVKWNYDASLEIGRSCEDHVKTILITGVGQKSELQGTIQPEELDFYAQCRKDVEDGFEFSPDCWKVLKDMGRLDKFQFTIKYGNISKGAQELAYQLYEWFQHAYYHNLEIDHFHGSKKEGELELLFNLSYFKPLLDVRITHSDQTVYYKNIHMPHFEPISVTEYTYDRYLRKVFDYHKPLCIVSGDHVKTFDDVVYKRNPNPSCSYLAFGHFAERSSFVTVNYQAVTIYLYKDVIEILGIGDSMSLLINNVRKDVTDKKPYKMMLTDYQDYYPNSCSITVFKHYSGFVVNSPEQQLAVYYDGHNLKIQTSLYFFGERTGLCGYFDGDKGKEFISINGTEHKNTDDFVKSYAILGEECSL